eukprot:5057087-Pyramimonas_sp.AAC.1
MNTNAYSTFETLLDRDAVRRPDFVAAQETHLSVERSSEVTATLPRFGWHAHAAPAEGAGPGLPGHGGLLLLAPRVHGMGLFEGVGSAVVGVGRATSVHHLGFCPGGATR